MFLRDYLEESGNSYCSLSEAKRHHVCLNDAVYEKIRGEDFYTLPFIQKTEERIASNLFKKLSASCSAPAAGTVSVLVREYEKKEGITLCDEQREAVTMGVSKPLSVITGGPGTGKSSVIKAITYVLEHIGQRNIIYAAPTGKAARRMEEITHRPAKTVQKLIGYTPLMNRFKYVDADCVIVDETSIMDMEVLDWFLTCVTPRTRILFVGDVEQLPSVKIGAVLRDMIQSNYIPVVMLEKTFRQAEESGILTNIKKVKYGISDLEKRDDFKIIEAEDAEMKQSIIERYLEAVEKYGRQNVCYLSPFRRKGNLCSNAMNRELQAILNPPAEKKPYLTVDDIEYGDNKTRHITFREGDPVMQLVNREECANGDVGVIKAITSDNVSVEYIDGVVDYSVEELEELTLAYAMSVHKSQGSEYPCVIMSVSNDAKNVLNRNLIYTGITRAKKECVLIGKTSAIEPALKVEAGYERVTFLSRKIRMAAARDQLLKAAM